MPEICKCPTPGTDKVGKCLAVALGGGGGEEGGWEELTGASGWENIGVFKRWSLLTGVR